MGDAHVEERAIPKDNSVLRNISDSNSESFFLRVRGGKKAALEHIQVADNYVADPVVYQGKLTADDKPDTYRNDDDRIRTVLEKTGNVISPDAPGFVDPENGDFRLKPGAPAAAISFQPIPADKIGLRLDTFRRRLPTPLPNPPAAIKSQRLGSVASRSPE